MLRSIGGLFQFVHNLLNLDEFDTVLLLLKKFGDK